MIAAMMMPMSPPLTELLGWRPEHLVSGRAASACWAEGWHQLRHSSRLEQRVILFGEGCGLMRSIGPIDDPTRVQEIGGLQGDVVGELLAAKPAAHHAANKNSRDMPGLQQQCGIATKSTPRVGSYPVDGFPGELHVAHADERVIQPALEVLLAAILT